MDSTTDRILLIEHCTRGMSATFSQFLFGAGGEVRLNMVSSLKDAQQRLAEGGFGLILLSLHLPECAGVEALRQTLAQSADVPVAVLINQNEQHLADEVREMGAAGCYRYGQVPLQEAIALCKKDARAIRKDTRSGVSVETAEDEEPRTLADRLGAAKRLEPGEVLPVTAVLEEPEEIALDAKKEMPAVVVLPDLSPSMRVEQLTEATKAERGASSPADTPPLAVPHEAITLQASEAKLVRDDFTEPEATVKTGIADSAIPDSPEEVAEVDIESVEAVEAYEAYDIAEVEKISSGQIQEERAARQELEGVVRALEERCRELEAGQTALIEAEHVAIEREKAARLAAEAKVQELQAQLATSAGLSNVDEERRRMERLLEEAQQRERQLAQTQRAELLEEQTQRAEELQKRLMAVEESLKENQWQLREARAAQQTAQARADELSAAAALASGATREIVELQEKVEVGAERCKHLENKLTQVKAEAVAAQERVRDLEALAHRVHALADKAEEADRLAEDLAQLRKDLQTESTARQLVSVELNKTQAREARLRGLEESAKELEWQLHQKEEELLSTRAQLDDLARWTAQLERERDAEAAGRRVDPARKAEKVSDRKKAKRATSLVAAVPVPANEKTLQTQVKELEEKLAQAEQEKSEFAQKQLNKLEELTALYEKAQLERLELSNQLANRPQNH